MGRRALAHINRKGSLIAVYSVDVHSSTLCRRLQTLHGAEMIVHVERPETRQTLPLEPRYAKFMVRTGSKHSTKQYILSYPQFLRRFAVLPGVPARIGTKMVLAQAPCRHVSSSFDDQQQPKNVRLPSKTKENNSSPCNTTGTTNPETLSPLDSQVLTCCR